MPNLDGLLHYSILIFRTPPLRVLSPASIKAGMLLETTPTTAQKESTYFLG